MHDNSCWIAALLYCARFFGNALFGTYFLWSIVYEVFMRFKCGSNVPQPSQTIFLFFWKRNIYDSQPLNKKQNIQLLLLNPSNRYSFRSIQTNFGINIFNCYSDQFHLEWISLIHYVITGVLCQFAS